jgi:REP element-mobilizing transposase RayT
MASTYTNLNIHIIFATKGRTPSIAGEHIDDLHRYLGGTLKGLGAHPQSIGGVADHVHVLAGFRPTHAISDIVRELKKASNTFMQERQKEFQWQEGYAAFSVSHRERAAVEAYIRNQEEHHRHVSSRDELLRLLEEFGVGYDARFFE